MSNIKKQILRFSIILVAFSIPFVFSGCFDSGGAGRPSVGTSAPDFTLPSINGESVTLSDYRGQVVLLNFWASWCPPCRAEMPSMEDLHKTMGGEDFVIIAVSIDGGGTNEVRDFIAQNGYTFEILHDKNQIVADPYRVEAIPTSYIIDKNGTIVEISRGAENWSSEKRLSQFRELITE